MLLSQDEEIRKTIHGVILDSQTSLPLQLANISFLNSEYGTVSDEFGFFTLKNSINADTLVISYVGYKSLIIKLDSSHYKSKYTFTLVPSNIFLQEVTVYSHFEKDSSITNFAPSVVQSEILKNVSFGMPDILRSIQALPGVVVNNEFNAEFNVRGGNQDENLVLVNNAVVYEPFHFKEASNANIGIFNMDLVKKVELNTGGFTAKYGDKMSSLLNIHYREGNSTKYKGAATLSLAYFDGYLEGPISEDISFIFGVRKSYLEYILSMIDDKEISVAKPSFYDVQGVLAFQLSTGSKLLLEFLHSGDYFNYEPSKQSTNVPYIGSFNNQSAEFKYSENEKENYRATYYSNLFDIQSINSLSSKTLLKSGLSYYHQADNEYRFFIRQQDNDVKLISGQTNYYDITETNRLSYDTLQIETFEFKTEITHQFTNIYDICIGASLQNIHYSQSAEDIYTYIRKNNFDDPGLEERDTLITRGVFAKEEPVNVHAYKLNGYIENNFQFSNDLNINAGGRLDYFQLNKDLTFSPRINIAFNLANNTRIRAAWGYYYQSPIYDQLELSAASDTNTQSQLAIHYIAGLDHTINFTNDASNFLNLKLEVYYKDYRNLISSYFGTFERLTYSRQNDAVGFAKGIDLQLILSTGSFYSWLSYGLLYAKEDKLNDKEGIYPRYTDQRHTFAFVANIDFGASWNFGLRAYYGSGFPYTPKTAIKTNGNWEWKPDKTHSAYLPAYRRVDIRFSKDFLFADSKISLFLDVSNVFNFRNIQGYEYKTPGFSKPTPEEILLWPILPSIGVKYNF